MTRPPSRLARQPRGRVAATRSPSVLHRAKIVSAAHNANAPSFHERAERSSRLHPRAALSRNHACGKSSVNPPAVSMLW